MPNCPQCQAWLRENTRSCPHCGADASWWLAREDQVYGPYDLATVRFILADDRATPQDLAMIGREGQWQPLGELIGEQGLATTGRSLPPVAATASTEQTAAPAKAQARYRNCSAGGWLVYVMGFVLVCAAAGGGIIWPAYARVSRESAAQQAESNLRQIGLALQLYAHESGGRLPPPGRWQAVVARYLPDPAAYHSRIRGRDEGYWYNEALAAGNSQQWSNKARLVVAAEPGALDPTSGASPRAEGFLYLYADGQVKAHQPGEQIGDVQPAITGLPARRETE